MAKYEFDFKIKQNPREVGGKGERRRGEKVDRAFTRAVALE
tara:strand:- start:264 stop:386 length:123 start_codon:yes stop_codon:yes gene_type:complete